MKKNITKEAWAAEKQKGKKLNKPFRTSGGLKKFSPTQNEKGNVVKVNFGDPNMEIKRMTLHKVLELVTNAKTLDQMESSLLVLQNVEQEKVAINVTKGSELSEDELLDLLDESEAKPLALKVQLKHPQKIRKEKGFL